MTSPLCVRKLGHHCSDNGLSPGWHQAIIWTNAGISLIGPLGIDFSEFLIAIHTFSFKKIHLKMSYGKGRPFCLGLNMLNLRSIGVRDKGCTHCLLPYPEMYAYLKSTLIGSCNGLVPSDNKPLPEPMLTEISVTNTKIWSLKATPVSLIAWLSMHWGKNMWALWLAVTNVMWNRYSTLIFWQILSSVLLFRNVLLFQWPH